MFYQDSWACTALLSWVYMIYFKGGISEIICPEVAELNSPVLLTCIHSGPADMVYIQPGGTSTAATCISGKCLSTESDRFSGTVVNMTRTYLEIKKAQLLDEGNWKCWDTASNITSNCSLILRKTPSCSITSYQNTENLMIGDKVTLSIRVKDYYCSAPSDILLRTGHVLVDVVKDQRTDSVTTNSFNSTFNVTRSHIGSLEIIYTCDGLSQKISCDGIHVLVERISELICPEVAELDSSLLLTCIHSGPADMVYIQPGGTSAAATCILKICISNQPDRFSGTVVNMTHSYLEIKKAQLLDEGNWKCRDTSNITSNCSLILRKTPSCSITSYQNTENLKIGDEVTLTTHVKDYYCSGPTGILLQTGHVLEDVVKDQKTDSITTNSFNSTFNVTRSHIGSLEIVHTCNGISQNINCVGIQGLLEKPAVCIITSDNSRQELDVDENITLIVYVEIYTCSQSSGYEVQTGQRMEKLVRRETRLSKNIDEFTSTFTVMDSHFGPVFLLLFCNNVSRNVSCEGVKVLNKRQQKNNDGMVCATYVGVGVSIGIGIIVIIVVIVVVIVMRTRKKRGPKDTEPPSVQGIAGPNLRRQESEFQGIAGPNMGRQESESQNTNNSQPLNNYEDLLPRPGNDYEELRVYNTCH